ncbi:MAG: hypothetical protein D6767_03600 [Candidatus Hydrogenedentota bacterium]|nr:MAG: hypothetical protein D6767_03600 [Candidatus Hydrogenedentota bacterium]
MKSWKIFLSIFLLFFAFHKQYVYAQDDYTDEEYNTEEDYSKHQEEKPKIKIVKQQKKGEDENLELLLPFDNDELPFRPKEEKRRKNVYGDKSVKDKILDGMEYQIGFIAEGAWFNNADLRKLDETTTYSIQNTDDKIAVALSRLYLSFFFPLTDDLFFNTNFFVNGFWGNDQLAGASNNNNSASTSSGANPFNIGELNLEYIFYASGDTEYSMKLGRQFFSIGGLSTDFMLRDYLDALTAKANFNKQLELKLLVVDFYQMAGDHTEEINYVRYLSHDDSRVDNFDGDVNTIRTGAVFTVSRILKDFAKVRSMDLSSAVYGFYARYGAVRVSGSDRTNLGTTGNFADNDYVMLFGNRWIFQTDPSKSGLVKFYLDGALSSGIDRKLTSVSGESRDIDTNGFGAGGGITYNTSKMLRSIKFAIITDAFFASGAKYDSEGNQTSHGFVSFKGSHTGGLLLNRNWGVHPSAYTATNGIDDFPHEKDRKAGTLALHGGLSSELWEKTTIGIDYWYLKDTGSSSVQNPDSTVTKAQSRLGKTLGQEMDFTVEHHVNQFWKVYFTAGIFLPGSYYQTPGIKPDSPYGSDSFVGFLLGSELVF